MLTILSNHSAEGYYFVCAWGQTIAAFDTWRTGKGYGKCTNYYVDSDYGIYTPWKAAFMPDNNYIPKNFLIDRDNNVRVAVNSTSQTEWNGWVQELL